MLKTPLSRPGQSSPLQRQSLPAHQQQPPISTHSGIPENRSFNPSPLLSSIFFSSTFLSSTFYSVSALATASTTSSGSHANYSACGGQSRDTGRPTVLALGQAHHIYKCHETFAHHRPYISRLVSWRWRTFDLADEQVLQMAQECKCCGAKALCLEMIDYRVGIRSYLGTGVIDGTASPGRIVGIKR